MQIAASQTPQASAERSPLMLEVDIPTTTAIVCDSADPYLILVGSSAKHDRPVLPGGKIDRADIILPSMVECAETAVLREIGEETGAKSVQLKLFGIFSDSQRDIRMIPAGTLAGTIVEDAVRGLADNEMVLGRYGVPDYVFIVRVDRSEVSDSSELFNLTWIDIRTLGADSLAAGHPAIVQRYQKFLEAALD